MFFSIGKHTFEARSVAEGIGVALIEKHWGTLERVRGVDVIDCIALIYDGDDGNPVVEVIENGN